MSTSLESETEENTRSRLRPSHVGPRFEWMLADFELIAKEWAQRAVKKAQ